MITHKTKPDKKETILNILTPLVRTWVDKKFENFTPPQQYGLLEIHSRNNILVSASTGSGKCITPETSLLTINNGHVELTTGHTLLKKAAHYPAKKLDTGTLTRIPKLQVYSLHKDTLTTNPALLYQEPYHGSIYTISTEYGREATITPDHPLLVETPTGMQWTPAQDLTEGQKIGVPLTIELPEGDIPLLIHTAIATLRKHARIVITHEDYQRLRNKTKNFTNLQKLTTEELNEIKTLLQTSFKAIAKNTNLGMTTVFRIFQKETTYHQEKLFIYLTKECQRIRFEKNRIITKNNGNQTYSFTYPLLLDKKLARWTAFLLAEGIIGDYSKGTHLAVSQINRKELLKEFLTTTKELFGMELIQKTEKDYTLNATLFCYFINELLQFPRGRGRDVPLPNWLLNATKDIKKEFLNVFFSLEGWIQNDGAELCITQSNQQKIEALGYVLQSFGIFPSLGKKLRHATNTTKKTKRQYYWLTISQIRNLTIYMKEIGIDHPKSHTIIKHLSKKNSGNYVLKHAFDYHKIRKLSTLYNNDKEFVKELGNIYNVVHRTGYITETALYNLQKKLEKHPKEKTQGILMEIKTLLNKNIAWLTIKKITQKHYQGTIIDLHVPETHNFIGGYGGLYLHNTLTGFLSILNELIDSAQKGILEDRTYCIYISPLKALSNDIEYNLNQPLQELEELAGKKLGIRVGVRTGDTSASKKAAMTKKPPHILITTPESLSIMLNSYKFREHLTKIDWCIVDEIHALAENKRGTHLSLSLERLQRLSPGMCRVGLSATVAPLEEIAKYLVGYDGKKERPCIIVYAPFLKELDLRVLSPVKSLIDTTYNELTKETYSLIHELVQQHQTTLIFTNTRAGTERVVHLLKQKYPRFYNDTNVGAHHGSLSKEHRTSLEQAMRDGTIKVGVTSTSLELGIDIGFVDLVILLGSPKSVARALQRCGRAGHKLHQTIKGRILATDRDDLVENAVLLKHAIEHKIDKIHIPTNCLDVLAQHIYGIAIADRVHIKELYTMITNSYCYHTLSAQDFQEIIDYLAGKYISLEDRYIYAKIWYDEETGMIGKKGKLARTIYMTNIGTIPDESYITVKIKDQPVGKLDESFLEKLKRGDIFVLGGNTYQFQFARGMVAQVLPAAGRTPTVPAWFSENLPLSFDLAMGIQRFRKHISEKFSKKTPKEDIIKYILDTLYVDENAAHAIYDYFKEQHAYLEIPHEQLLLIEHYDDDTKTYVVFHALYGRRVNDVLSRAVAYAISRIEHKDVEIGINDNGFYIAYSKKRVNVSGAFKKIKAKDLRNIMDLALDQTEVLRRRFRHCATRALMILRSYKGQTKRVGRQQVSSMILLNAVKRISTNFPILKEARREVLEDLMDIDHAEEILKRIEEGKIHVKEAYTTVPSPFAFNLVLQGKLDVMKADDKIAFLKRMHHLVQTKIKIKGG